MRANELGSLFRYSQTVILSAQPITQWPPITNPTIAENVNTGMFRPIWAAPAGVNGTVSVILEFPINTGGMISIEGCQSPPSIAIQRTLYPDGSYRYTGASVQYGYASQPTAPILFQVGAVGPDFDQTEETPLGNNPNGMLPPIVLPIGIHPMNTRVGIVIPRLVGQVAITLYSDLERPVVPAIDPLTVAGTLFNGFIAPLIGVAPGSDSSSESARVLPNTFGFFTPPADAFAEGIALRMSFLLGPDLLADAGLTITRPGLNPLQNWPVQLMDIALSGSVIARPYRAGIGVPSTGGV